MCVICMSFYDIKFDSEKKIYLYSCIRVYRMYLSPGRVTIIDLPHCIGKRKFV